jgi:hypothetical protein
MSAQGKWQDANRQDVERSRMRDQDGRTGMNDWDVTITEMQ